MDPGAQMRYSWQQMGTGELDDGNVADLSSVLCLLDPGGFDHVDQLPGRALGAVLHENGPQDVEDG